MSSSIASKELVKTIMNKFKTSGHSSESSHLIMKYFIGFKENNMSLYQEDIKNRKSNIGVMVNNKVKKD